MIFPVSELCKWEASVRQRFAERLGLPRWVSASATVLHPLDRLTARFRCKKCDSVSNCYKMDSCLDFVGVCRHVCKTADENDESEMGDSWDASRFDRDERASEAMKKLLALLDVDEASIKSLDLFKKRRVDLGERKQIRIECLTCQPTLVLESKNVVRGGFIYRHI
ncbi:hypothetical protein AX14_009852 [Amanita brunnescens Koide BX004]|nr:hypothetical protein AX14_009852 [Amanita brunnescens Koide BX004]